MLLRSELEQSRIFIHFWIREDDCGGGGVARRAGFNRGAKRREAAGGSAEPGKQRGPRRAEELAGSPATVVWLVSKGHSYSGARAGGGIARALRAHAQDSVLRTLLPHEKLLKR